MTTVGYGDVYPKSTGGRILGMFICVWGVLLESLMVATISEFLNMDTGQTNSYTIIQRLVFKHNLKKQSVKSIE